MVVGERDDRRERKYSNGEINRELTTLKRNMPLTVVKSSAPRSLRVMPARR